MNRLNKTKSAVLIFLYCRFTLFLRVRYSRLFRAITVYAIQRQQLRSFDLSNGLKKYYDLFVHILFRLMKMTFADPVEIGYLFLACSIFVLKV